MGTISLTDATAGTDILASLINNNNTALETAINGGLDNTNIASGAAIAYSKLALTGAILNADIAAAAAIAVTKIAPGTALQLLRTNSGATAPEWATLALAETAVLTQTGATVTGGATSTLEFDVIANTQIDGGTLGANGCVIVEARGTLRCNSGSLTPRIYWGGTVRWGDAQTFTAAANSPWLLRLVIGGRNATGTQTIGGLLGFSDSAAGSVAGYGGFSVANHPIAFFGSPDIAVDSTANQNVRLTFQFSASDGTHHVTRDYMKITSEVG